MGALVASLSLPPLHFLSAPPACLRCGCNRGMGNRVFGQFVGQQDESAGAGVEPPTRGALARFWGVGCRENWGCPRVTWTAALLRHLARREQGRLFVVTQPRRCTAGRVRWCALDGARPSESRGRHSSHNAFGVVRLQGWHPVSCPDPRLLVLQGLA